MNKEVSLLEKTLVNWFTPVEGLIYLPVHVLNLNIKQDFKEAFDKYGVFRGVWELKVNDYQRLLNHASKNGKVAYNVLKLYDSTPCGTVMKLTYKAFR